jgi:hypothetical protein
MTACAGLPINGAVLQIDQQYTLEMRPQCLECLLG